MSFIIYRGLTDKGNVDSSGNYYIDTSANALKDIKTKANTVTGVANMPLTKPQIDGNFYSLATDLDNLQEVFVTFWNNITEEDDTSGTKYTS